MSARRALGPIVIDTDVYDADLVRGSKLAAAYEPIIVGRSAFISFQTAAELRYGAFRRNWGPARMLELEGKIAEAEQLDRCGDGVFTAREMWHELVARGSKSSWPWVRRLIREMTAGEGGPEAGLLVEVGTGRFRLRETGRTGPG